MLHQIHRCRRWGLPYRGWCGGNVDMNNIIYKCAIHCDVLIPYLDATSTWSLSKRGDRCLVFRRGLSLQRIPCGLFGEGSEGGAPERLPVQEKSFRFGHFYIKPRWSRPWITISSTVPMAWVAVRVWWPFLGRDLGNPEIRQVVPLGLTWKNIEKTILDHFWYRRSSHINIYYHYNYNYSGVTQ